MKKFQNNMWKKIRSNSGMSLLEMLCAVMILLLVSGGMTTAVSLAARQYQISMRGSEAQVLCSTLKTVIANELAYTTDIRVDTLNESGEGNVKMFQSQNYVIKGNLSTLMTDESGINGYGQILLGNSADTGESMNILGKASYSNGLLAKISSVTYSNRTCCFTLHISIGYDGTEYYGEDFQVLNVNRTQAKDL
ncbi:MAG: prepilin-type N-terminal cleavage/methylation domain-containing protein [Lachnospiraceae bacterium]